MFTFLSLASFATVWFVRCEFSCTLRSSVTCQSDWSSWTGAASDEQWIAVWSFNEQPSVCWWLLKYLEGQTFLSKSFLWNFTYLSVLIVRLLHRQIYCYKAVRTKLHAKLYFQAFNSICGTVNRTQLLLLLLLLTAVEFSLGGSSPYIINE